MYLISIYFDDHTNKRIQGYINSVAEKSKNTFMLDAEVPPHLTISSFEARSEEKAVQVFNNLRPVLKKGVLQWVSVGVFFPYVIYITPVLNKYLHELSESIFEVINKDDDIIINKFYYPFQWFPHTTIAKKLSKEEMNIAFSVMQNRFGMFTGEAVKIGIARTNPHRDLLLFDMDMQEVE